MSLSPGLAGVFAAPAAGAFAELDDAPLPPQPASAKPVTAARRMIMNAFANFLNKCIKSPSL